MDPDSFIYNRAMTWLNESDLVVAEISTPSLGVGYEIGKAEDLRKPILCLYRPAEGRELSAIIDGNNNIELKEYSSLYDATQHIQNFMRKNFGVSEPKQRNLESYL